MKNFSGKILFLDRSDINTDEIIPAKYLTESSKAEQIEGHAMIGRCAVLSYCLPMSGSRVAFVAIPMIDRIFCVKFLHAVVPVGLCQDACSRNTHVLSVAFDDGCVRQIVVWLEAIAINNNFLWSQFKPVEGTMHGENACSQDVDAVYLFVTHDAYCPSQRFALDDLSKCITLLLAELL